VRVSRFRPLGVPAPPGRPPRIPLVTNATIRPKPRENRSLSPTEGKLTVDIVGQSADLLAVSTFRCVWGSVEMFHGTAESAVKHRASNM